MRKPLRLTGGLLINPRRRKAKSGSASRFRKLNLKKLTGYGALTVNPRRKRKAKSVRRRALGALTINPRRKRKSVRRSFGALTINPRRRRNPRARARRNPRRTHKLRSFNGVRRNPRRRALRRNPRRKTKARASIFRTNPRRRSMRRNPRSRFRRNPALRGSLAKIPLVGPALAAFVSYAAPAAFGAVATEPTIMAAHLISKYAPGVSTAFLYPLAGMAVAAGLHVLPFGSKDLKGKLSLAAASGGAAIGYYLWRTSKDQDAASEMHGLALAGYGSPIGMLTSGLGMYGDGGPMRVVPMHAGY